MQKDCMEPFNDNQYSEMISKIINGFKAASIQLTLEVGYTFPSYTNSAISVKLKKRNKRTYQEQVINGK